MQNPETYSHLKSFTLDLQPLNGSPNLGAGSELDISRECRPCTNMQKSDPSLSAMSSKELAEFVKQDQAVYDGKLKAWEADRCEGKRAKRTSTADAGTKVVGEQSSGVEPRQILGYHWPLQLLQEHEIEFDKKQVFSYRSDADLLQESQEISRAGLLRFGQRHRRLLVILILLYNLPQDLVLI